MLTLRCSGDIRKEREWDSKGEIVGEDLIQEMKVEWALKHVTTEKNRQGQDQG